MANLIDDTKSDLFLKIKKFFNILEKTPFKYLKEKYNIDISLKDFLNLCLWLSESLCIEVFTKRFYYLKINTFEENFFKSLDFILKKILLFSLTIEIEPYLSKYMKTDNENEKKILFKKAISWFWGEDVLDAITEDELLILINKDIDINDKNRIEKFLGDKPSKFIYLFGMFKTIINSTMFFLTNEFKLTPKQENLKKVVMVNNYYLQDKFNEYISNPALQIILYHYFYNFYNILDDIFQPMMKESKFVKNLIKYNKSYYKELIDTYISETTTTADVGSNIDLSRTPSYQGVQSSLFGGYTGYDLLKKNKNLIKRILPLSINKEFIKNLKKKQKHFFLPPKKVNIDTSSYEERYPRRSSTYAQDATEYE